MKKLLMLFLCWSIPNSVYGQFNYMYDSPRISEKVFYKIGKYVKNGLILAYDSTSYMKNENKIQREMTIRIVRRLRSGSIEEFRFIPTAEDTLTIKSVKAWLNRSLDKKSDYYKDGSNSTSFRKPLQVSYNDPNVNTTVRIKTGISDPRRDPVFKEKWAGGEFDENPQKVLLPKNLRNSLYTSKQLRDVFRQYTLPKVFYFEVGVMPAVGGRILQVMNRQPDISLYSKREQNEGSILNYGVSLKLGFDFDGKNSLYVAGIFQQQGFSAQGHLVDWSNGLSTDIVDRRYDFQYFGFETGYSANPFKENSAFSSDVGLHFLFASGDPGTKKFSWGPHLSIGPKFRIGGRADIRILPTGYLNVKRLETGTQTIELATRLYSIGLKIAVRQYF